MLAPVWRTQALDAQVRARLCFGSSRLGCAALLRAGRFADDESVARIVAYHERQDRRFADAAAEISDATGKPVLTATELAVCAPDNAGPAGVRESGRYCFPSAQRAVRALEHLWRHARHRQRRDDA